MITSLTLENFRGFDKHVIHFKQKTLLVGKNNAGKSTCVEALRLVSLVTERLANLSWKRPPKRCGYPYLDKARRVIPEALKDRVFVLGTWSEPERLREALGRSLESIGELMAEECEDPAGVWTHELLRHNGEELDRIRKLVCPFLIHG